MKKNKASLSWEVMTLITDRIVKQLVEFSRDDLSKLDNHANRNSIMLSIYQTIDEYNAKKGV